MEEIKKKVVMAIVENCTMDLVNEQQICTLNEKQFSDLTSALVNLLGIGVVSNNECSEVTVCCGTCEHGDGDKCKHPQGCESDYELWEKQTDC